MARARLMLVLAACAAALALCVLRGVLADVARHAGDTGAAEQHPVEGSGAFLWILPELTTVRVRVLGLEGAAPGPGHFSWRRKDHGDKPARNRGRLGRVSLGAQPTAVVELAGMGYAGPDPAPAAQPAADGVELDLPLGTFELLLELDGDPDPQLERIVTLPADAPDGVLTLAL